MRLNEGQDGRIRDRRSFPFFHRRSIMVANAALVCHRGAREVDRDTLLSVPCPQPQGRWRPVPFATVLQYAEQALAAAGYRVAKSTLALSRRDERFFGTLTLDCPLGGGADLAVGIRSSHDQSLALGWCCGQRVFVCDNLAFSAAKVISHKHTAHGVERYQEAIARAVSELSDHREYEAFRIRRMQSMEISDAQAESVLLRAVEAGIVGAAALPVAIREWRTPSFAEFAGAKTAWRLYNALTCALGKRARTNPQAHAWATIRLGALVSPETEAASTAVVPA